MFSDDFSDLSTNQVSPSTPTTKHRFKDGRKHIFVDLKLIYPSKEEQDILRVIQLPVVQAIRDRIPPEKTKMMPFEKLLVIIVVPCTEYNSPKRLSFLASHTTPSELFYFD